MTPLSCFRTTAVTAAPLSYRLFQLTTSRFYGSVAAAEPLFDPNNYYSYYQAESDSDQHRDSLRSVTLPDTEGRERRRGVHWAFIGSPRAKKHVYAEMLSKLLEVPRISMSSIVRQDLSPRSSLHKQVPFPHNPQKHNCFYFYIYICNGAFECFNTFYFSAEVMLSNTITPERLSLAYL